MEWFNLSQTIKQLKKEKDVTKLNKTIGFLYSNYEFGVYDTENYTYIEKLVNILKKSNDIDGLNAMLIQTSWYKDISQDLDFIKFLIKLGANAFNETAAQTGQFATIDYLITNHGVNNFEELAKSGDMWNIHVNRYDSDASYPIYLIEKGLSPSFFNDARCKHLLSEGGGIILNKDPSKLKYSEALPYVKRHARIKKILDDTSLIPHVISIIMEYVLYETS